MMINQNNLLFPMCCGIMAITPVFSALGQMPNGWNAHDLKRPQPTAVQPGPTNASAPSDAIALFDGQDLSKWVDRNGKVPTWKVVDGTMTASKSSIQTVQKFGDCQLHLEFATPKPAKGEGQQRGNSGVYFMGKFEVQILDSYNNPTYADGGAGALYGQHAPLVNASREPGQWQTYDIVFRRPRFKSNGDVGTPASVTVFHNGVLVQDKSEYFGPTDWLRYKTYQPIANQGPLKLQFHGSPVRFRNIWLRELKDRQPSPYESKTPFKLTSAELQRYTGQFGDTKIFIKDDQLVAKFKGRDFQLRAGNKTEFYFQRSAGSLVFEFRDQTSPATACKVMLDAVGSVGGMRKE